MSPWFCIGKIHHLHWIKSSSFCILKASSWQQKPGLRSTALKTSFLVGFAPEIPAIHHKCCIYNNKSLVRRKAENSTNINNHQKSTEVQGFKGFIRFLCFQFLVAWLVASEAKFGWTHGNCQMLFEANRLRPEETIDVCLRDQPTRDVGVDDFLPGNLTWKNCDFQIFPIEISFSNLFQGSIQTLPCLFSGVCKCLQS